MYVQNIISKCAEDHIIKELFQKQFLATCLPLIRKYVKRVKGKSKKAQTIVCSIVMDISLNEDKYQLCDKFKKDKGSLLTTLLKITNYHLYADLRGQA